MSLYYAIPIMLLSAVMQSTWLEGSNLLGGRPDLGLLLVITWSIIRGSEQGALWGFIGGLFYDLLTGGPLGLWTVTLTSIGYVTGMPWVHALGPTYVRLALMTFFGTLLAHMLLMLGLLLFQYPVNVLSGIGSIAAPAALINSVLSPISFNGLVLVHRRVRRPVGEFQE